MTTGLIVDCSLPVQTKHGECRIELCLGSVTQLTEPVDVLVISAYPGDYSATPSSVIGALLRDFQISVKNLAKDKEEDLRKFSCCWWSKPLKDLPYKRILCFEGGFKKGARPPSTVSEVFRSLNSLCRNENITVIMPLLASGDQGFNKKLMMRLIVEATIHWMQIGLPMKLMKLVLFTRKPNQPDQSILALTEYFNELKSKWLELWEKKTTGFQQDLSFKYDVYLSNSPLDQKIASMVLKALKKQKMRVFHERQEVNEEESFQEEIYQVMITCARVVAILSPRYMTDISCIEQYNIGLCCTRNMERDYLAPLFVEEITRMPTYMGLIQYVDCRPITEEIISEACQTISLCIKTIKEDNSKKEKGKAPGVLGDEAYDLFLSYSHQDVEMVNAVLKILQDLQSQWKIFIDQSGLRAGVAWQSKLYNSIENSSTVVAFLSYNYTESKVCQEEYNLARSLHEDPNYATRLIEIKLDNVDRWPVWCSPNFLADFTDEQVTKARVKHLINIINIQNRSNDSFQVADAVLSIKHISSIWRTQFARQNFPILKGVNFLDESKFTSYVHESESKYDLVLSYHQSDLTAAVLLMGKLKEVIPSLKIATPVDEKSSRLHVIDEGRLIIPLLSSEYIKTPRLMEEFNTALCRHRFSEKYLLFPIVIGELPISPVYPQIALCLFSLLDEYWLNKSPFEPLQSCLKFATVVILNILMKKPRNPLSFKTLLSMRELEEWSFHKTRYGDEEESDISPICFTAHRSGHDVAPCGNVEQKVSAHNVCPKVPEFNTMESVASENATREEAEPTELLTNDPSLELHVSCDATASVVQKIKLEDDTSDEQKCIEVAVDSAKVEIESEEGNRRDDHITADVSFNENKEMSVMEEAPPVNKSHERLKKSGTCTLT